MFCSKCGNSIKENEKFCSKCGQEIQREINTGKAYDSKNNKYKFKLAEWDLKFLDDPGGVYGQVQKKQIIPICFFKNYF